MATLINLLSLVGAVSLIRRSRCTTCLVLSPGRVLVTSLTCGTPRCVKKSLGHSGVTTFRGVGAGPSG